MAIRRQSLQLLVLPVGLMGLVQVIAAILSLTVFNDGQTTAFFLSGASILLASLLLLPFVQKSDVSKINYKDALFYVSSSWLLLGLCGAIPIILIAHTSITDGVFESISAITTTGATILTGLDEMPQSFLIYRQFLQWLGGLGIVIFVVAILPMLNVGGMKLLKAETPGPMKDEKITPRVTHAALYLWLVYVVITLTCALSYYLFGMNIFDSVAHALSTVSTGGFSTHDASMGYFNSPSILLVSDVFMLMGAISFTLHFKVWQKLDLNRYWRDEETRTFIVIILVATILISTLLIKNDPQAGLLSILSTAFFHLISFITSTGFAATDLTAWPAVLSLTLVTAGYLGGCSGSTAGGNKIIRNIISVKIILKQVKQLIHPSGVFKLKYNQKSISNHIAHATMAFMFISALTTLLLTAFLMLTGLDFWSSFSAVASCINVLGPAFGELGNNFIPVSDMGSWMLSLAMILGRLEYFTLLTLIMPSYWLV